MANDTTLNTPVLWINKYLQAKIPSMANSNLDKIPFFPSTPSTIDNLTEMFPEGGVMATWDRLIKMNRRGFPHIKCEQLLYYFYATAENTVENMIQVQEAVFRLMDRYDETAEELNNWCSNRQVRLDDGTLIDNTFYFHNFKVYQLEETRDIIDFGTARTYGGNKIIIDFDYHQVDPTGLIAGSSWKPEYLATKEILD
jgi:hypothetical protein